MTGTDNGGLRFRVDWEPADHTVLSTELRETWARLEVWVDDECITLAEDLNTGATRRAISVSLYPLAEWIAYNWWAITEDSRPSWQLRRLHADQDRAPSRGRARSAHALRAAGDGFTWPNLFVVKEGDFSHLRWWSDRRPQRGHQLVFLRQGAAWVDSSSLERALGELVEAVLERLVEAGVADTPLAKEWGALRTLDSEEVDFCRAVARLGLDPFDEGQDLAVSISEVFADLEPGLRDEFLDAASPTNLSGELNWVREGKKQLSQDNDANEDIPDTRRLRLALTDRISKSRDVNSPRPWELGYHAAREVRALLNLDPHVPISSIPVDVSILRSETVTLQGLCGRTADIAGRVVLPSQMHPPARRFAEARSLSHLLMVIGETGYTLLTASSSRAQQVSRAFAAELLAPATGIGARIRRDGGAAPDEALADIAAHFQVSDLVIRHQLENQLFSSE